MRNDKDLIEDILEAIKNIEKYTSKGRTKFDTDELIQVWIIHHTQIIGEHLHHLLRLIQAHQAMAYRLQ